MKKYLLFAGIACMVLGACNNEETEQPTPVTPQELAHPIHLAATRADGNARQVGIYMVYGSMQSADNYLNNLLLTNDGTENWSPEKTIYWMDNVTAADFIGYAPYSEGVNDAMAYEFSVKADQSTTEALQASDFLWGKLSAQEPTEKVIDILLNHRLSRVVVKIAAGEGFTEDELKNGSLSVRLNGFCTGAIVNLSDGTVAVSGSAASIIPCKEAELQYGAIVVPQTVESTGIVTVTWNGSDYTLTRSVTFAAGKRYTLTVTLKKTQGGINIGIGDWEDAGEDFGGTVN